MPSMLAELSHEQITDTPPRMVSCDGASPAAMTVLQPREKEGDNPPTTAGRQPPSDPVLQVLRHDPGRYLIVSKPADVRIDGEFAHTVEKLALVHITGTGFDLASPGFAIRFVHRLDYATSGVLLLGLARHAAGVAAAQFEKRETRKVYLALVHGHFETGSEEFLTFSEPIADTQPPGYHMVVGTPDNPGRASLTKCFPVARGRYHGAKVTKVRLEPRSGRRHQLRVHCAHAGMPIVGDATYIDDDGVYFGDGFIPPRMMLHAHQLSLRLPQPGSTIYGRKSALREAVPATFTAADPFREDVLGGLSLPDRVEPG